MSDTIEKVSIIISKGSLEGIYPGLIMANGARMEGIEANVFFTFFGLDAINRAKHDHVKVATVGNPGLHLATWAGGFPGISSLVTRQLAGEMEKLDIPPIPEFVEMISDSGAGCTHARHRLTSSSWQPRTSYRRSARSSRSASSTRWPAAGRSSSPDDRRAAAQGRRRPVLSPLACRSQVHDSRSRGRTEDRRQGRGRQCTSIHTSFWGAPSSVSWSA